LTRENKIALVIGFAIVLVVGVLLSDHLAQTERGHSADMSTNDQAATPPGPVRFIPLTKTADDQGLLGDVADEASGSPPSDDLSNSTTTGQWPMHVVKNGDTLSSIARLHYGDARVADQLANANPMPNPNSLTIGVRLLIPPRSELGGSPKATPTPTPLTRGTPTATAQVATLSTYTVKDGDTLSELAQSLMGTMHAADKLLALNKTTLNSPRGLRAGMKLHYQSPSKP
jgi:LysM repeat protein